MNNADLKMALYGNNASKSYKEGKEINEYAIGEVPAGALNISVEELSHLAMMINANGMYNNNRVLKFSTLNEMFSVQNKNVALDVGQEIGLGYFIDKNILGTKDVSYHHGGNTIAQNAYFIVSPHSKLGVVVMANTAGIDATEVGRELLKKAWEEKTGKKVEKKKWVVKNDSDFEGTYSTVVGKVSIKKASNNTYNVSTDSGTFELYKTKNNTYKIKYKLLGLFSISHDMLDKVELYTDNIEGHNVIVASMAGRQFIGGKKVEIPTSIPKKWKSYVGHYKVLNNFEMKEFQIKDVEFVIEDGYPLVKTKNVSGETSTIILKPINDTEAIIEGLGRSMRETIYFKDSIFYAQGLRFEKVEEKK
jgi:hypothetical protein